MLGSFVGMTLLSSVRSALRRLMRLMMHYGHVKHGCFGHRRCESQPDVNDQESLSHKLTVRQRTTRSLVLSRPFWVLEILPIDH